MLAPMLRPFLRKVIAQHTRFGNDAAPCPGFEISCLYLARAKKNIALIPEVKELHGVDMALRMWPRLH